MEKELGSLTLVTALLLLGCTWAAFQKWKRHNKRVLNFLSVGLVNACLKQRGEGPRSSLALAMPLGCGYQANRGSKGTNQKRRFIFKCDMTPSVALSEYPSWAGMMPTVTPVFSNSSWGSLYPSAENLNNGRATQVQGPGSRAL